MNNLASLVESIESADTHTRKSLIKFKRVLFLSCPTGAYCREDRCQSFFNFELIPTMRAPLEECEIAGALRDLKVSHQVIDAPAEKLSDKDFLSQVAVYRPDLIVLAVTFGSLEADLQWASKLREVFPSVPIGLRGAPCYVWDKFILEQNPSVDFCVRGDYEIVFNHIVTRGVADADGVTSRYTHGEIRSNPAPYQSNLDLLPLPDRSGIRSNLYSVRGIRKQQATVRVQRGCPFPCTYCLVHTVSGNRARHRSAESIVSEMSALMEQGVNYFYLRAETFSVDRRWVLGLCSLLSERCKGVRWVTTTRVECVDEVIIAAMQKAGCYGISFGVDVASAEIGRHVKKPPRKEEARTAMRLCDKYNIVSLAYFMVGFIWESRETLAETRDFIRDIRPDLLTIHFAHPYPGTPYYQAVQDEGLQTVSLRAQAEPALNVNNLLVADLTAFARRTLLAHYLRPSVLWSLLRKLTRR